MINFKNTNGWAKAFYIISIILMIAAIVITVSGIKSLLSYLDYGYSFSDVGGVSAIIQMFVPYFFYALATWGIGLILNKALGDKQPKEKKDKIKEIAFEEAEEVPALEEGEDIFEIEEECEECEEASLDEEEK